MFMKKAKPTVFSGLIALLLCGFMILSCSQDSVFYYISREEAPTNPRINGSPTNIIVIDDTVFVGSRMGKKIHYYRGDVWYEKNTEGSLIELAAAGEYLYALFNEGNSFSPNSTVIKRIAKNEIGSGSWQNIVKDPHAGNYTIESLYGTNPYGTGNDIFAGGVAGNSYVILHIKHNSPAAAELKVIKELVMDDSGPYVSGIGQNALLNGAAIDGSGNVFLATGAGIYKIDVDKMSSSDSIADALAGAKPVEGTFKVVTDTNIIVGDNMVGILAVKDNSNSFTITAVSRKPDGYGSIHIYDSEQGKFIDHETNERLSGAMCVWKQFDSVDNAWKPTLLLLGVSDFKTEHGYRELVLVDGKPTVSSIIKKPDNDTLPRSIKDKTKYAANIGKYSIRAILQLPESVKAYEDNTEWEPTIFASTYTKGLWSYKSRGGEWGWNAEE
jgi:hypothetical protein